MSLLGLVLALLAAGESGGPACKIAGQPTVSVLPVQATGVAAEMAQLLADSLRGQLVATRCFKVQSQAEMTEILEQQNLNASEACDESCVVEQGRLLQVRYLA